MGFLFYIKSIIIPNYITKISDFFLNLKPTKSNINTKSTFLLKNYQKKVLSLYFFAFFINVSSLHSQSKDDILIYNWFDKVTGKENLDINNGTLNNNPYKTIGYESMYYNNDDYQSGTLNYENQIYFDVYLKYDLYNDQLIINPSGLNKKIGINLNSSKVASFTIGGKHFVKIDKKDSLKPEVPTGYYEEIKIAPDFIFYIKHHKEIRKKISDNGVYYNFTSNNLFFIKYLNKISKIERKKDILKLFPEQKKQINEFYLMNREIKKSNLNQFMENLIKSISNSYSPQTK